MSVRIHWRPCSEATAFFKNGTSTSFDKIKQAFGSTITKENIPSLYAMRIASDDLFYEEVAKVIEKCGDIEIWGEY